MATPQKIYSAHNPQVYLEPWDRLTYAQPQPWRIEGLPNRFKYESEALAFFDQRIEREVRLINDPAFGAF